MNQTADPHELLATRLRAVGPPSGTAEAQAHQLPMRVLHVPPRHDVVREDGRLKECCLILDGFFVRHTMVGGDQRQILSFHLPGDMPNLHSLHIPETDFALGALTAGSVALIPQAALRAAIDKAPDLGDLLWRFTFADAAISRAWLASVGRRSAYQRVAHLFCETFMRMRALGLTDEAGFMLPLTQTELADALGLSVVHVNRTLQQLRHEGLIVSRGRYHGFTDWRRLQEAGDFDGSYLFQLENRPLPFVEPPVRLREQVS